MLYAYIDVATMDIFDYTYTFKDVHIAAVAAITVAVPYSCRHPHRPSSPTNEWMMAMIIIFIIC